MIVQPVVEPMDRFTALGYTEVAISPDSDVVWRCEPHPGEDVETRGPVALVADGGGGEVEDREPGGVRE